MSKYHSRFEQAYGINFRSKKEAQRYRELRLLEKAGKIRDLELQPRYDFIIKEKNCGFYKADFRYEEAGATSWSLVVEDVKGFKTPMYKFKKKLVEAMYGITILET